MGQSYLTPSSILFSFVQSTKRPDIMHVPLPLNQIERWLSPKPQQYVASIFFISQEFRDVNPFITLYPTASHFISLPSLYEAYYYIQYLDIKIRIAQKWTSKAALASPARTVPSSFLRPSWTSWFLESSALTSSYTSIVCPSLSFPLWARSSPLSWADRSLVCGRMPAYLWGNG